MFRRIRDFCEKHSSEFIVALFLGWVVLLVVGTIAEIFDIAWILDWPIWRPPGKVG